LGVRRVGSGGRNKGMKIMKKYKVRDIEITITAEEFNDKSMSIAWEVEPKGKVQPLLAIGILTQAIKFIGDKGKK